MQIASHRVYKKVSAFRDIVTRDRSFYSFFLRFHHPFLKKMHTLQVEKQPFFTIFILICLRLYVYIIALAKTTSLTRRDESLHEWVPALVLQANSLAGSVSFLCAIFLPFSFCVEKDQWETC